jgi:serine/threonine protein kinase
VRKLKKSYETSSTDEEREDEVKLVKQASKTAQEKNDEEPIDVKKQNLYAVKILSKQMLIKAKQVDHVFNEMSLMTSLNHPFIVSLLLDISPTYLISYHIR